MRNFFKFTFILLFTICAKAQVPTATILGVSPVICTDANNFFAAKTTFSPTAYKWSLPANKSAVIVSRDDDSSVVVTFSLPGLYTLSLTVSTGTLSSTTTKLLSVTRSAKASFNASLTATGYPNQLSLTDYSSNSIKSYWTYSESAAKDSASYIVRDYPQSGSYTVTLLAIGRNGCNNSASYAFRISDSSGVTLPNIFSPNDDGVNDVYKPITRGISSLKASVFNRYGALISSWDRVNGTWDGYTTSGLECSPGTYMIVVEATGFDGNTYKQKSTITLVR